MGRSGRRRPRARPPVRPSPHLRAGARPASWNPQRDGAESHQAFLDSLHSRCQALGLPRRKLLAKKGDALIWHADLVHGGAAISRPGPRHSLVCHYCPGRVQPFYFRSTPARNKPHVHRGNCHYASRYYDLDAQAITGLLG